MRSRMVALSGVAVPILAVAAGVWPGAAQEAQRLKTEKGDVLVETVAAGLEHPWGLAFLPEGGMLVTEREGRVRLILAERPPGRRVSAPLAGVPRVAAGNQGGLLDIAVDPEFAETRLVYLSYAEPRQGGANGTSVARGKLNAERTSIEDLQVIFRQEPSHQNGLHFGSRLVFANDGMLYVTLGERFALRDQAQNPGNHLGKIVRINADGTAPGDNPGASDKSWRPEIWSIGHRNVQSAALNPLTGELWTAEHGARGGDEINIPRKGRNYGWPVISYGVDYSGAKIGIGTRKAGMEQPVHYWDPSIAPSGMAFYTGALFPAWRGNILVGALAGALLARLEIDGEKVVREERMLKELGERIRDVRQGPDGALYLLTDQANGRLLRLVPAARG